MSEADYPRRRRGAAGMLLLFSLILGGAGAAFELLRAQPPAFWIGAMPGARAGIGAVAVLLGVLSAHLVRSLLARRLDEKDRDAGDHV